MNVGQANAAFRLRRWLLRRHGVTDEQALTALAELITGASKRSANSVKTRSHPADRTTTKRSTSCGASSTASPATTATARRATRPAVRMREQHWSAPMAEQHDFMPANMPERSTQVRSANHG